MTICIAGIGYVGLANAILLAQHHEVVITDIIPQKVELVNRRQSPFADLDIEEYLKKEDLSLFACLSKDVDYNDVDFAVVATPTDYNPDTNLFNTDSVESVINAVLADGNKTNIVIRSTVPVGFTSEMNNKYGTNRIIFAPEFLREGSALYDCLHPSRIVVGGNPETAETFSRLLLEGATDKKTPVLLTGSTEAEAIKLFSNAYLAMRIAYINELDTFAEINNLDSAQIINGICSDPRIGEGYNNPSFGYGGYCLPKDTKQLKSTFNEIPNNIIQAIVTANQTRKVHITNEILSSNAETIGIYRLTMKTGADNFRDSSVIDVIINLKAAGCKVIIYEPLLENNLFEECNVINDLDEFLKNAELIIANRMTKDLTSCITKVYTRDIFRRD